MRVKFFLNEGPFKAVIFSRESKQESEVMELVERIFMYAAIEYYNELPASMKDSGNVKQLNIKMK